MKSRVLRLRAKEKKIGGKKRVKVDECFIKAVWELSKNTCLLMELLQAVCPELLCLCMIFLKLFQAKPKHGQAAGAK